MDKKKLMEVFKSSVSGFGCTNILKDSSTFQHGHFHSLAHIAEKG